MLSRGWSGRCRWFWLERSPQMTVMERLIKLNKARTSALDSTPKIGKLTLELVLLGSSQGMKPIVELIGVCSRGRSEGEIVVLFV